MSEIDSATDGATPVDPDESEGLRFVHVQTRGQLDELEQVNIQAGLQWLERQRNADILSERFIRDLHQRLFGQVWKWAGSFRTTGKHIGCDPRYIPVELHKLLGDTRYWIEHETYSKRELAIRFHHRLVSIHPFPNGNGRHARIMADALLMFVLGQPPIDWAGGHELQSMSVQRKRYIAALRAADTGDYQPLLEFVGL